MKVYVFPGVSPLTTQVRSVVSQVKPPKSAETTKDAAAGAVQATTTLPPAIAAAATASEVAGGVSGMPVVSRIHGRCEVTRV